MQAIKACIVGLTTKETVSEFVADDEGNLKLSKQKVSEKTIPPNTDIIKLIYQHCLDNETSYDKMTDEELENEKIRLLCLLKEEQSVSRKSKSKSQM